MFRTGSERRRLMAPLLAILLGGFAGALWRMGTMFRSFIQQHLHPASPNAIDQDSEYMTLAFLTLGPIAIGFLTVRVAQGPEKLPLSQRITLPWAAVLLGMFITMLCALEGAVCLIFALPITLFFGSIGGLIAGAMAGRNSREQNLSAAVLFLLQILGAPMEARLHSPLTMHTVENVVDIDAPAEVVWRHVERVAPIARSELRDT